MRRLLVVIAGLSMIPMGLACQHTAGKCDCDRITPPCAKYGLYGDQFGQPVETPKAEMLPPHTFKSGAGVGN